MRAWEPVGIPSPTPTEPPFISLYTSLCTGELNAIRKHKCFLCSPFYGRACRRAMLGELKPKGPKGDEEREVRRSTGRKRGGFSTSNLSLQRGNVGSLKFLDQNVKLYSAWYFAPNPSIFADRLNEFHQSSLSIDPAMVLRRAQINVAK